MGVPAFFRWLTRKYPSVIVDAVEEKPRDADGNRIPVKTTDPNPNFQEFDNLYLDMNGIIHPCTHPEDRPAPKTEDEMFALIFEYIDRLFAIVRPRRLLYMAIDGVAPRAKMNQQRSRRFRASKEAADKTALMADIRAKLEAEGIPLPPAKADEAHFDSNCITPGTPFMSRLAIALRYYIHMRLSSDPGWQNIQVILSDANAPGEGEHKVMDFIRRQRASPSHDPNTVHCLCGADADLIMLGLATHEPNFNIVREEFIPNQQRPCELCGQYGHEIKDCKGLSQDEASECQATPLQKETNFIFVRIPVLREYLEKELSIPNSPIPFDLERSIDDWVFMCFFVGNDFLPHLPSLEIRENAIDRLIKLYKEMVYKMKGYLTDSGSVHMDRVQLILDGLGEVEDEIFRSRQEKELAFRRRNKMKRRNERRATAPAFVPSKQSLIAPLAAAVHLSGSETRLLARDARIEAMQYQKTTEMRVVEESNPRKRKHENNSDSEEEPYDEVRLWESGWKDRYYKSKFEVDADDLAFRRKVAWAYVEGLCWVLKYYYQGCASWDWYFPYHYAPFASDFDTISQFSPDFSAPTEPFKPLQQLMSVFPAASKMHLPESWQHLMTDSESPIIDFYPDDFQVDLNGKKYAWQGVALLPFVDEKRLLETLATVECKLDATEKERNAKGPDRIFVGAKHPLYKFLVEIYEGVKTTDQEQISLDTSLTAGVAGTVTSDGKAVAVGQKFESPILHESCPDIAVNFAVSTIYADPKFELGYIFPAKRLPGAKEVERTLKPSDWNDSESYYPVIGFGSRGQRGRLSDPGHRMLGHEMQSWERSNRSFQGHERGSYQEERTYGRDGQIQSFSSFMHSSFSSPNQPMDQFRPQNFRQSDDYRYSSGSPRGQYGYGSRGGRGGGYDYGRGSPSNGSGWGSPRPLNSFNAYGGYEQGGGFTPRGRGTDYARGSPQRGRGDFPQRDQGGRGGWQNNRW